MKTIKRLGLAGGATLVAIGLAACGTTVTGNQPATVTRAPVTITQAPVTVTQASATVTQEPVSVPETTMASLAPTTGASSEPVGVPMPDVVGMNLQAAQNYIQTLGVFYSRSEDATGAGRLQVLDRNWVVVGQTPEPGTLIGEGDALLYVEKIGE